MAPALAEWERKVGTEKVEFIDTPAPHSLQYFLRNECAGHTPYDRLPTCDTSRAKLRILARVEGYTIYLLDYCSMLPYEPEEAVLARSVLVRSKSNEYHEIYHRSRLLNRSSIPTVRFLAIDRTWVLMATYEVDGLYPQTYWDFFNVGENGVRLMHDEALVKSAKEQLPDDSILWRLVERFNFETMTWSVGTEPKVVTIGRKVACCTGNITVRFAIEKGDFVAREAAYHPN